MSSAGGQVWTGETMKESAVTKTSFSLYSALKKHKSHKNVSLGWVHLQTGETMKNLEFSNSFYLFTSADWRHNKGVYHKSALPIVYFWLFK